ncbi:hypothetical protein [Rodentibacter myodis]|uniref:Uncharacterized protein n=1 Tax=Rodentibacter myodis TaxID=1907939 RepID=A0A1V3JR86_9PAST|nr:hypothetical protein [Rodentibacter myodis]OOF59342.1 hypothetical protein BKL49_04515 [Rodentibacter myodis]
MFSFILNCVKQNHNKVIKFFQGFLAVLVCLVGGLVIFSEIYGIPETKIQEWIKGINVFVIIISVAVLLMLFISYLSPNDYSDDEHVISGKSILDIVDNMEEAMEETEEEKLQTYAEYKTQWTTSRILSAIKQQEKKSIINLLLGIVFSLTGALVLLYLAHSFNFSPKDTLDFISNFLPRLSFVLLIETFAYFFLRLYKDNLQEIKYWNDELTAIEHRVLALNLALRKNDETLCQDILKSFSKFEKINHQIDSRDNLIISPDYLIKIIKLIKK